jgi:hypothetical protein
MIRWQNDHTAPSKQDSQALKKGFTVTVSPSKKEEEKSLHPETSN